MNDPHVVAVHYELKFEADVQYKPPLVLEIFQGSEFDIEVEGSKVRMLPKIHFADRQSARTAADRLARNWEVLISLEVGTIGARLVYEWTEIVDRNPTTGVIELHSEMEISLSAFGTASVIRPFNKYPTAPDSTFNLSPDTEFIWLRYKFYKEGREPLLSMAYFVLSAINARAGNQKQAAKDLNIQEEFLKKIGELSSGRGDSLSARKMTKFTVPLEPDERVWLEKAVEKLIIQVGRSWAGSPAQRLTMGDVPPL
ncbi:hypothetical protein [Comamonas sp. JNW]|uniref:hypothetical protein n=1 Tax=Comamonas sp. JNW TaxID=2170731 RepID=UPI001057D771|nr:hypothetical protein [Comamonas sp. JNW]